jgi:hypothetical protein
VVTVHNIAGSEVQKRTDLLPGYAAFNVGPPKRWQWRWQHTTLLFSITVATLTFAGTHGLLP